MTKAPAKKRPGKRGPKTNKTATARMLADSLGVRLSAVYHWKATGTLPKNPFVRAAYVQATKADAKAVAK